MQLTNLPGVLAGRVTYAKADTGQTTCCTIVHSPDQRTDTYLQSLARAQCSDLLSELCALPLPKHTLPNISK